MISLVVDERRYGRLMAKALPAETNTPGAFPSTASLVVRMNGPD